MPPKASRRPASPYSGHDKGTTSTRATNAKRQKKGHDDNELNKHLDSGLFSDFTIICGERKFNVHRIILASKGGSFFANLLSSGMQETHEQKCDLSADDVDVVEGMIQFMYDQDIQRERQENEALEDAIRYYVDLFVLADKYQILALQRAVKDRLSDLATSFVGDTDILETVLSTVLGADAPASCTEQIMEAMADSLSQPNNARTLMSDAVFKENLKNYTILGTKCALILADELHKEETKLGNITAVACMSTSCPNYRRRWTYKHGPLLNATRYCMYCGGNNLATLTDHDYLESDYDSYDSSDN